MLARGMRFAGRKGAYPLLECLELTQCERVGLANDGNDIDTRGEAAHELNVHLAQPLGGMS